MRGAFTPADRRKRCAIRLTRWCIDSSKAFAMEPSPRLSGDDSKTNPMNESRFAGRVGAFVVVALMMVAALLLVFSKGMTWFTPTYTLRLRADNVGGLKA